MIKIIHTADWHLGKKFFQLERINDHDAFLSWLISLLKKEKPDAIIIAGDIFDCHQPPHSAQKQFYRFLKDVSDLSIKVIFIAGNHDSKHFLNAPEPFYENLDIFFKTSVNDSKESSIVLKNGTDELELILLPFFKWSEINQWYLKNKTQLSSEKITSKNEVINNSEDDPDKYITEYLQTYVNKSSLNKHRKMLVSHHSFGQYHSDGTELNLNIAGIESIDISIFKGLVDYIALGHIHRAQKFNSIPETHYSGSPIVFRHGENKQKYLNIIKYSNDNFVTEKIIVPNLRNILQLKLNELNWKEKIDLLDINPTLPTFLSVVLLMEKSDYEILTTIKNYVREKGHILINIIPSTQNSNKDTPDENIEEIYDLEKVFEKFYYNKFPNDTEGFNKNLNIFKNVISEIKEKSISV